MKTAKEVLDENFKHKGVSNIISKQGLVYKGTIKAMVTYATQQTADLTTQLAKANSDKERLGEFVKQYAYEKRAKIDCLIHDSNSLDIVGLEEAVNAMEQYYKQITECLTDCGITL
jgi:NCAIR mutase (PurE)-related protein